MRYAKKKGTSTERIAAVEESGVLCVPEDEVARQLSVSRALLRKWRRLGGGPRWIHIGRCIRYQISDLHDFLNESSIQCTEVEASAERTSPQGRPE